MLEFIIAMLTGFVIASLGVLVILFLSIASVLFIGQKKNNSKFTSNLKTEDLNQFKQTAKPFVIGSDLLHYTAHQKQSTAPNKQRKKKRLKKRKHRRRTQKYNRKINRKS